MTECYDDIWHEIDGLNHPFCEECGKPPDFRGIQRHHVKPKGMGGVHGEARNASESPENTIYLCGRCHSAKHGIREVRA